MHRLWLWLLIPVGALGVTEACVRSSVDRVPTWYRAAEQIAEQEPLGAVFFGSSRVQASIVPRAFDEALAARGRRGGRSLNLGLGHTTDAEHYFGLRRVLAANPRHLEGLVVFAEAPGGMPWPSRWKGEAWAFPEQPGILVEVIDPRALPRFCASKALSLETRAHVVFRTLLRPLALVHRRERFRRHASERGQIALATGRIPEPAAEPVLGADLEGPGALSSIRTDPVAHAEARRTAEKFGDLLLRHQAPIRSWAGTIQEDIVRLVQAHGARMVFFEPPQSEPFQKGYRTPMRQADVAAFAEQARRWNTCLVRPAFPTTDEDFPDLWHLRTDRSAEFSAAVASEWLDRCGDR